MIHLITALPLNERYTHQWYEELQKIPEFMLLGDDTTSKLDRSRSYNYFTNLEESIEYELCQIVRLFDQYEVTTVLIADLDFPGIAAATYPLIQLKFPDVRYYGILHAGSWCYGDIFEKSIHKASLEKTYFDICRIIFVATYYHKRKIISWLGRDPGNILVLEGLPFWVDTLEPLRKKEKKHDVMVIGRPEQTSDISQMGWVLIPEIVIDFHHSLIDQVQYLEKMSTYKIVVIPKVEETFGYCVLEAVALGCIPLVPDRLSYIEILPRSMRYEGVGELLIKIQKIIKEPEYFDFMQDELSKIDLHRYSKVFERIRDIIQWDK